MEFSGIKLARDLFDGKVNAIACVGSGDIVMKGMISMLDNLNRILAENTGRPIEEIYRDTERDNYMTAQEALEYGLVDKVIKHR